MTTVSSPLTAVGPTEIDSASKPTRPDRLKGLSPAWGCSVLLLLLTVVLYFQTWTDLWPYWEHKDATYTHGTLIALVTLWLIWRTRPSLEGLRVAPQPWVLALVVLLSATWLLAARANVMIVHTMLWPVLAVTILWAGVGGNIARRFLFPIGFLYFAIPFWDYFKPTLQIISSTMVGLLTSAAGLQAIVDGPNVSLPHATIFIALDCSGAHFLSVALAVGALTGEIRGERLPTRILIMGIAGLLSMLFNWLRIFMIVLAYLHAPLREGLETIGHLTFGWWVFALDLVVFYLAVRLVPSSPSPPAPPPEKRDGELPESPRTKAFIAAIVAAALVPVSSWAIQRGAAYPATAPKPVTLKDGSGPVSPDLRWQPRFDGTAWAHRVAYVWRDRQVIELYRNEYHHQEQGRELISAGNSLFSRTFQVHASSVGQLPRNGAPAIEVNRTRLSDSSGKP